MLGSHAASHKRPKAFICSLVCMSASVFLDVRKVRKCVQCPFMDQSHGPMKTQQASHEQSSVGQHVFRKLNEGAWHCGKHSTQKEGPRRPWLGHRIRFCMLTAQCPPTWPPPMILPQVSHKSPALHQDTIETSVLKYTGEAKGQF